MSASAAESGLLAELLDAALDDPAPFSEEPLFDPFLMEEEEAVAPSDGVLCGNKR